MNIGMRFPAATEQSTGVPLPDVCSGCVVAESSEQSIRIGRYCREVVLAKLGAVSVHAEAPGGNACQSLEADVIETNFAKERSAAQLSLLEGFGSNGPARF